MAWEVEPGQLLDCQLRLVPQPLPPHRLEVIWWTWRDDERAIPCPSPGQFAALLPPVGRMVNGEWVQNMPTGRHRACGRELYELPFCPADLN